MRIWISLLIVVIGLAVLSTAFSSGNTELIALSIVIILLVMWIQFVHLFSTRAGQPPQNQYVPDTAPDNRSYADDSHAIIGAVGSHVASEVVEAVMDGVFDGVVNIFTDD